MSNELPKNFEEFADARRVGFLKMKEAKDAGHKVCGMFCQYTPAEIIHAAGLKQVALCGRSHLPNAAKNRRHVWGIGGGSGDIYPLLYGVAQYGY